MNLFLWEFGIVLTLLLCLDLRVLYATVWTYSCGFEEDKCGITLQYDDFDWKTTSGGTPSMETGPDGAHNGTYYIYAEAAGHDQGSTAKLMLPVLVGPYPRTVHLSFWYHMYGDDMGEFKVYTTGSTENLFYEAGDHRNQWFKADIGISFNAKNSQIMIEAIVGVDFRSDIAIDALEIKDIASGALLYECDFEDTLCGIQQIYYSSKDTWVRHSNETETHSTGPPSAYSGSYYIYTEASTASGTLIMYMPELDVPGVFPKEMCSTFYYHMYGMHIGSLGLYVGSTTIFHIGENQGYAWYKAQTQFIIPDEDSRIHMDAVLTGGSYGDIAVDNITISLGPCPPDDLVFMCNFERDLCGIDPAPSLDKLNWEIASGSTPSLDTGPDDAHSGTYYAYLEASGHNYEDSAALMLPELPGSYPKTVCLSFWYHMYGEQMGALRVNTTDNSADFFYEAGDQGNVWLQAEISVTLNSEHSQIVVEASRGSNYLSDIAIDDLIISETCSGSVLFQCDFEDTMCEIRQLPTVAIGGPWQRQSEAAISGYYSAFTSQVYGKLVMLMPELNITGPFPVEMCASFFYYMCCGNSGTLDLYVGSTSVYYLSGSQGEAWNRADVQFQLDQNQDQQIYIVAVLDDYQLDIAIDDIHIYMGSCLLPEDEGPNNKPKLSTTWIIILSVVAAACVIVIIVLIAVYGCRCCD